MQRRGPVTPRGGEKIDILSRRSKQDRLHSVPQSGRPGQPARLCGF